MGATTVSKKSNKKINVNLPKKKSSSNTLSKNSLNRYKHVCKCKKGDPYSCGKYCKYKASLKKLTRKSKRKVSIKKPMLKRKNRRKRRQTVKRSKIVIKKQ